MNILASCRGKRGWLPTAALTVLTVLTGTTALPAHAQYTFLRAFGTAGSGNGQFTNPEDVKLDSNGNIFVADSGNDRIEKFNANAQFVTAFGSTGFGSGQLNQPLGIGVDSNNNIFVSDTSNDRVEKFTFNAVTGVYQYNTQFGMTGGGNGQFLAPIGVAFDSSNTAYVVDNGNNRVESFTFNSTTNLYEYSSQFGTSGAGQLSSPYRLAIDSTGNVFVADTFNSRVEEFDKTGAPVRSFTYNDPNGNAFFPQGVAVDAAGNVFATDFLNNRVLKFSSTGQLLAQFGTPGSGAGQFNGADGIAVDSAGNVFVTDLNNNRVEEFGIAAVPEMGSLFMLAGMAAGGMFMTKRRQKQK